MKFIGDKKAEIALRNVAKMLSISIGVESLTDIIVCHLTLQQSSLLNNRYFVYLFWHTLVCTIVK